MNVSEFFVGEGGPEVGVVFPNQFKRAGDEFGWEASIARPTATTRDESGRTLRLVSSEKPAALAFGEPEDSGGGGDRYLGGPEALQDLETVDFLAAHSKLHRKP